MQGFTQMCNNLVLDPVRVVCSQYPSTPKSLNISDEPILRSMICQQLREAFPDEHATTFLIHDNDATSSDRATEAIHNLGIESKRTAYRSPWQNGIAERWV